MVTLQDIHDARAILGSRLHRTPVLTATTLGAMAGVELLVKAGPSEGSRGVTRPTSPRLEP